MQRQAGASGLSLLLLFALLPTVALKRNVPHTEVKNSSTSLVDYAVVVEVGRSAEASAMAHVFEYTMPVARAVFPEVLRIPHRRISVGTTAPAVVQTNATRVWPISLVDLLTDAVPFEKRSKSIFEIASRRSDRGSDDLRNLQSLAEARGFKVMHVPSNHKKSNPRNPSSRHPCHVCGTRPHLNSTTECEPLVTELCPKHLPRKAEFYEPGLAR